MDSARRAGGNGMAAWLQTLFIVGVLTVLATPPLLQTLRIDERRLDEGRAMATRPAIPAAMAAIPVWTAGIDSWLQDHFGLRSRYITAANRILFHFFGVFGSPQVVAGPTGRLFLTSHSAAESTRNSLIQVSCGYGVAAAQIAAASEGLTELLRRTVGPGLPNALVVIVPTAVLLHPQELPPWLRRQCATAGPPLSAMRALLPTDLREKVVDLLPVMAALDQKAPMFPRHNFHWDGLGPMRVAAWLSEEKLGRRAAFAVPTAKVAHTSDISMFFPGLRLADPVVIGDLAAAGVGQCRGRACLAPMLGERVAQILDDMQRVESPTPDGRLLLITDSFGNMVTPGFAPYFRDVVQVSVNNLARLTADERARFRQTVLEELRPDTVLLLFHDGVALEIWDKLLRDVYPR